MDTTRFGGAARSDHVDRAEHAGTMHGHPTPREFYAQFGRVVLFCLGLAMIAHVIVAVAGAQ